MKNTATLLSAILGTNASADKITAALNLISEDPESGLSIKWTSSNPSVLAASGRVVRPKWDEEAVKVSLTASLGESSESFDLTVLPDEYVGDTMAKTDDRFFGNFYNGAWRAAGELNYSEFPELSAVQAAAKESNYEKAKEELLLYMRKKLASIPRTSHKKSTLHADYAVCGMSQNENNEYCTAEFAASSSEYRKIEIALPSHGIKAGAPRTYSLISKYRDSVALNFAGSEYPEKEKRPLLSVYVNGSERLYSATKSATIRAGAYKSTHIGSPEELRVKMFGEFLGDETYRALLQFDTSDISDKDTIGDASLILYAKKSNDYSEPKAFYVIKEPDITWQEDSVTWLGIKGLYYNFNGIEGFKRWDKIEGANVEYLFQTIRFGRFLTVAEEYRQTGDENYAYSIIYNIMNFIKAKDCLYVRPLDSNLRLNVWTELFKSVINSKYMTPDICTAMLKRFFTSITVHTDDRIAKLNAAISKFCNVIKAASLFGEYTDSRRCKEIAVNFFNTNVVKDFFPDGAYVEDTGTYNKVSHREYVNVKRILHNEGIPCSEEFDERLRLGAYYDLLLRGPDGERFGFGDESTQGKKKFFEYEEFYEWYGDEELRYIDTRGEKGKKPAWTSKCLPYSTYVFLRSDWTADAHMLFTNVRHGSCHAHADDNGIILFGYGKNLLTDAGYVDYEATKQKSLGSSALMHNTVEINNVSQQSFGAWELRQDDVGVTNDFAAGSRFDFVSQTSFGYRHIGNEHTRTITFVKPDFYIVSDIMRPEDKTAENSYKQLWHMTPNAGLYTEGGKIYSNHPDPGNIIIACADSCELHTDLGPYTISYGGTVDVTYAYYQQKGKGNITFDSVLLPYKGEKSSPEVERIDIGMPTSEATALKIHMNKDGDESTVYYMLRYEKEGEITFGKYKTDAKMAIVIEHANGETEFITHGGNYTKPIN